MPDLRSILVYGLTLLVLTAHARAEGIQEPRAAELEHMLIQDCGSCHGLTMNGGLGSPLTPEALDGADPETLAYIILEGVPGTAMPAWRPLLSDDEAHWIAQYLLKTEHQE
jgi:cytochrome c55X